ncbi:MAG: hypothetical protein CM15mP54_07290 [Paracoccaceae bacterium]|nr:MAG: hypothetical protein CM15mP54_07290 [Paracoccaceae bacterium]
MNIVQGFGVEAGKPLASSNRIAKVGFTGETTTGKLIMQYASENLIPVTLELGGKSPNIYFKDVMDGDDAYISRCVEGFCTLTLIRARFAHAHLEPLFMKIFTNRLWLWLKSE